MLANFFHIGIIHAVLPRAKTVRVFLEDAPDDRGLCLVNLAFPGRGSTIVHESADDPVTVAVGSGAVSKLAHQDRDFRAQSVVHKR